MAMEELPQSYICGVRFSCVARDRAANKLAELARVRSGGYVCVTGAHGVVSSQNNDEFRQLLNGAAMNTLDGQPVVWLARFKGHSRAGRVTGRELVYDVVGSDPSGEIRHIFIGATAEVTDRIVERLRALNPRISLAPPINPPFKPLSDEELDALCREIETSEPAIIWIGLSTPKQEQLAVRLSHRLPHIPVVAIGAGFDFVAGLKPVAPGFVTKLGLEWFFRMMSEPKRLVSRYADIVPKFIVLAFREITGVGIKNAP